MKNKAAKILSTMLSLSMLLGLFGIFNVPVSSAQAATTIEVINPLTGDSNFTFVQYGDGGACRTFYAEVWIKNAVNVASFQIALEFDKTMLNVIDVYREKVAGHFFAGRTTIDAPPEFDYDAINADGRLVYGSATFPLTNVNGSGWTAKIKFHIIKNVTEASPEISSTLFLRTEPPFRTFLEDKDGVEKPFTPVHGSFKLRWEPVPLPKPWLKVDPPVVKLGEPLGPSIIGTPQAFFTINIVIKNVVQERKLIGIQSVVLYYNESLLRLVDSWEGPWLRGFAPYGTLWINVTDPGSITIGVVMWPNPATGEYDWTEWPEGEGVIATIKFEAIMQEEYPWAASTPLNVQPLFGNYFLDANDKWIPYEPEEDGEYRIIGWILGRMIDVYVCEYPAPFGGQGLNVSADMFRPQKTVCLCANVTYNAEPVQTKLVTFEIIDPKGNTIAIRTAFTDKDGVARICFGLPWPCEDPWETIFGEWTVVASVDIRCTVVKDWLKFKVWWELELTSVTPKQTQYTKCQKATFVITFRTYRMQAGDALIFLTVYDDLDVPIGSALVWVRYGHGKDVYCKFWEGNVTLSIHVPKWAFVGVGKAYVSVLSTYPSQCGDAYGPEKSATFTILKST